MGAALGKLAAERCARLNTMLAGHQEGEEESRGRLAFEASFDDSAEGERLHRYQARWGRSLLRTLAALEELRGRGRLDHQEAEEASVGQDSDPVIACIEETRLESKPSGNSLLTASSWVAGAGSPSALDDRSGASLRSSPATLVVSNTVMGSQKTSADLPCPTGGRDVNEGPAESVGAHPVEETERVHDRVAADDPSIRRQEKRQNKPTAVTRTLVKMEPCVERPVGSKATMARSPGRGSDQSGPHRRSSAAAKVVNYPCRESCEHDWEESRHAHLSIPVWKTVTLSINLARRAATILAIL